MNAQNIKTEAVVKHESVRVRADKEDVRVVKSKLTEAADLAISEECDPGSDPYNSTGQHVIIKSRLPLED